MRKIIHKLRQRPEDERRHILHLTVFILALILLFFWVLSLGVSISKPETKIKVKQDLKPFSILKGSIVSDNPLMEKKNTE